MKREITVKRYLTLAECFRAWGRWTESEFAEIDQSKHYWCGNDGHRPYRKNVKKWFDSNPKAWGWAEFRKRMIHVYIADDCPLEVAVSLIAHEIGHLRLPRPKDKMLEERKAERYAVVARTAVEMASKILEKRFDGEFS